MKRWKIIVLFLLSVLLMPCILTACLYYNSESYIKAYKKQIPALAAFLEQQADVFEKMGQVEESIWRRAQEKGLQYYSVTFWYPGDRMEDVENFGLVIAEQSEHESEYVALRESDCMTAEECAFIEQFFALMEEYELTGFNCEGVYSIGLGGPTALAICYFPTEEKKTAFFDRLGDMVVYTEELIPGWYANIVSGPAA